jgi:hypothetical protein
MNIESLYFNKQGRLPPVPGNPERNAVTFNLYPDYTNCNSVL